jgi:hypothetical protein
MNTTSVTSTFVMHSQRFAAWQGVRLLVAGALAFSFSAAAGCAPAIMQTPASMVELDESRYSAYAYRATTPDGVVLATRTLRQGADRDIPEGSLEFWADALRLRMRTASSYALLSEEEVRSANGSPGLLLRFGRDLGDRTYVYNIAIFVGDRFLHVVEFGGPEELVANHEGDLDQALAGYRIRR